MKIIAVHGGNGYVAIVTHSELEKLTDKYYGKLEKLKEGDEFDLGAGHNFRNDIRSACSSMTDSIERFRVAQKTLISFAEMVRELPKENETGSDSAP